MLWNILMEIVNLINSIDSFIVAVVALMGFINWIHKNKGKIIDTCKKIFDWFDFYKKKPYANKLYKIIKNKLEHLGIKNTIVCI